jgi:ribulose-5-phosphate 4-epimerase/fuculose-1-phosphate aldolase
MDNMTDLFSIEHFWINPLSKHFSQIRVSDLVLVNENGEVQPGGAQYPINGPAFAIHSEIHKARPDLNAACHAHSVYGKAFSCFGTCMGLICVIYMRILAFHLQSLKTDNSPTLQVASLSRCTRTQSASTTT